MKLKPNYLVIPLVTVLVAVSGSFFTTAGMPWYDTELVQPELTPPDWIFPIAWNTIFILATISALIVWNTGKPKYGFFSFLKSKKSKEHYFWLTIGLFVANAFLNVFWSFLFFYLHLIKAAFVEMFFLEISIIALMITTFRYSKWASLALLPYAAWVAFASYLTWLILSLN